MSRDLKIWFAVRGRGLWPVSPEGWILSIGGLCAMSFASAVAVRLALAGDIATPGWLVLGAMVFATIFLLVALRHSRWRRPLTQDDPL